MKKLMYIIGGIIALLVVLVFTGKKSVHHEIIINAKSENVWEVLVDMKKYPDWNPVMQLLGGDLVEGERVKYQFTQDESNQSVIGASVEKIIPNELLNQKGGLPFILTFDHKYILKSQGEYTKVIIHEDYSGIGVNFWNPQPVETAYGYLNNALKARVESLNIE